MKKLLLGLAILSSFAVAEVETKIEINTIGGKSIAFGTQCIGGYLFAFAVKGDYRGGISLQQIFKDGSFSNEPNDPVECK